MSVRTVLTETIPELTTPTFEADFVDEGGVIVTALHSVLGWLYDGCNPEHAIINNREAFDLMPFVTAGHLSWTASADDTEMLRPTRAGKFGGEQHVLLVQWTWAAGAKVGAHEIEHTIVNLVPIP